MLFISPESSFRSQDIYILLWLFGHASKRLDYNGRKMLGNSDCTKILLLQFTDQIAKSRANRGN